MLFDDIIGNDYVKKNLKTAVLKKSLSNTLLFSGVEGVGKLLFAKELSSHLMFSAKSVDNIKRIENETHPDLHILRPEGKVSLHSISSIRKLKEQMSLSPYEALVKVFIIEDAHCMLPTSFNALLKTLEEPSLDSYIILITDKEKQLLPTITSRCVKFKFSPLSDDEIISVLKRWGKTDLEIKRIVSLSQGSISRASEIASFVENDDITQILLDIFSNEKVKNYFELSKLLDSLQAIFDDFAKKEDGSYFKSLEILFSHIYMWYRDLYLYKQNVPNDFLFYSDKIDMIEKQDLSNLIPLDIVDWYISEAISSTKVNIKIKNSLENLFLKLNIV
jgi:DNA polymerase-3 subunit delta'